jgi:hypothetical protein
VADFYQSIHQVLLRKVGWKNVIVIAMTVFVSFNLFAQLSATQRMVLGEAYTNYE